MSTDVIFWTQIASLVALLFALFGLYRLLVDQKDATIQLLKETNAVLKDQLETARSSGPDVLARSLADRVKLLEGELERLSEDKSTNHALINTKEEELREARHQAEELTKQVVHASELLKDFLCPHCGAPLSTREYHSELVEYQGREIDVDHDYTEYECGYSVVDGRERTPCRSGERRPSSAVLSV